MRVINFLLVSLLLMTGSVYAQSRGAALQSVDGTAISSTNPLPVTFGSGDQVIDGTLYANGGIVTGGVDERVYGSESYVDFNDGVTGSVTVGSFTASTPTLEIDLDSNVYPSISGSSGGVRFTSPVEFAYPGRFGIGTTVPGAKLEIDADVYTTDAALLIKTGYNATANTFSVNSSGNVGIGTVSPNGAFVVRSADTLGWSLVSVVNQACTTTCSSAAVVGQDSATGSLVVTSAATADVCLCAGSN